MGETMSRHSGDGGSRWPRLEAGPIGLAVLLLLAAAVRIWELDRIDVWVDEANSILTARHPLPVILRMLETDSSPPAYYLLLHFWMAVFGDSPVATRLLAVAGGVGLVASVYAVGRRWISTSVGLWAAFVVAVSPVQIFYSQQARMYSLLPILALWSVWSLVGYLRTGRVRDLAVCLATAIAALFLHNFAFHLLPVLALVVAVSGQLVSRWQSWLIAALVVAGAYAAWVPTLLEQVSNEDHYAWFLPLWEDYGPAGAVLRTVQSFSPAAEYAMFEYRGAHDWGGWPAAALAALAAYGGVRLARSRSERSAAESWWAPILLVLPIATSLAVSSFLTPHYVPGRVDQMMFPAYALLAAVGLAAIRPAFLRGAVGAGILVLGIATMPVFRTDYREYGYRGGDRRMASVIRDHWEPGDVILCTSLTRASVQYYLRDLEPTILSFPRDTALHLGAQNDWPWLEDPEALGREADFVVRQARKLAGPRGRLFLVRSRLSINDPLAPDPLRFKFGLQPIETFGRFAQVGTEDVIWLSLHWLRAPPAGEPG